MASNEYVRTPCTDTVFFRTYSACQGRAPETPEKLDFSKASTIAYVKNQEDSEFLLTSLDNNYSICIT